MLGTILIFADLLRAGGAIAVVSTRRPSGRVTDRRVVLVVAGAGENIDVVFDGLAIERGKARTAAVGAPPLPVNFAVGGGGALWLYAPASSQG